MIACSWTTLTVAADTVDDDDDDDDRMNVNETLMKQHVTSPARPYVCVCAIADARRSRLDSTGGVIRSRDIRASRASAAGVMQMSVSACHFGTFTVTSLGALLLVIINVAVCLADDALTDDNTVIEDVQRTADR